MDIGELRRMIEEDEFELLKLVEKPRPMSAEERLIAAYQEIVEFVEANGREPSLDSSDISEKKLAMRRTGMSVNEAQRTALAPHDTLGLLKEPEPPKSLEEVFADDAIGLLDEGDDLFRMEHVPVTKSSPERVAQRQPCEDFDEFKALFTECHTDLRTGIRKLLPFKNPQQISEGSFFVLKGVLVYVARIGERLQDATGDSNARLRCIFENATESDLLLRSLASQLYQGGKTVTQPEPITRLPMQIDAKTPMGVVYVLRSLSEDEQVKAIPHLHKIGCTVRTTEKRTRDALKETTYLLGPIEIIAEYLVPAGVEDDIEGLLHRVFDAVRLDVTYEKDGAKTAEAREWFSVPLDVIDEAIQLIQSESIVNYEYDPETQRLRLRDDTAEFA
jgi:hypothetical protein